MLSSLPVKGIVSYYCQFLITVNCYSSEESSEVESSEEESEDDEQSVTSENEEEPTSVVKWSLVCSTAEDWEQLAEVFKKSKQRDEKALFQTLTVDFLPEIEKMIEAKVIVCLIHLVSP